MNLAQIIIPAGTVCMVAGVPLKFTSDTPVEGPPDELALLHSLLYPPATDGVGAVPPTGDRGVNGGLPDSAALAHLQGVKPIPMNELAPAPDERLHQLASNRCLRQSWPDAGREWTFNEVGLREFALAVLADSAHGVTVDRHQTKCTQTPMDSSKG